MAIANGAGPSYSNIFSGFIYHVASSFGQQRVQVLEDALNTRGATKSTEQDLRDVNLVVTNSLRFEGWDKLDKSRDVIIVTDKWVERSIVLSKPQPPQYFSANPGMIFSGITATATGLPLTDLEVLSAGITALGGQWRAGLTKDVTHLFAISADSQKYATALSTAEWSKVKVLLPHWFDDAVRLGTGKLGTQVYEWPDPPFLKGVEGILLSKDKKAQGEGDDLKRTLYSTAAKFTQAHDSTESPSIEPEQIPPTYPDVWHGRKFVLSRTLQLYSSRREAVQLGIERAGGIVIRYEGDDEPEEDGISLPDGQEKMSRWEKARRRKEAERVEDCDVLITRWRHGSSYRNALRGQKTIGTLSWLFHVQATGVFSRPTDQLLHFPIPKKPIENFSAHVITLTNYTGEAREYLKKLIAAMGASFTPSMSANNTALIAAYVDGTKSTKAQSWSIPVVNHTWLEDCFVQWRNLTPALEKYVFFPPGVNFATLLGERGIGAGFALETGSMEAKWLDEVQAVQYSEDEADEEYIDTIAEVKGSDSEEEEMRMPLGTDASMKEVAGMVGLASPSKSDAKRAANNPESASATPRKRGRPRSTSRPQRTSSRARSASRVGPTSSAAPSPEKTPQKRGRPRGSTSRGPSRAGSPARSVSRPRGRPPGSKSTRRAPVESEVEDEAQPPPPVTPVKPKSRPKPTPAYKPKSTANPTPVTPARGRSTSRKRARDTPSRTASVDSAEGRPVPSTSGGKLVRRVTVELEMKNLGSQVSNTPAKPPPELEKKAAGATNGVQTPSVLDRVNAKGDGRTRVKKKRNSGASRKAVEDDSEDDDAGVQSPVEKAKPTDKGRTAKGAEGEAPKKPRGRPRKNVVVSQRTDDEEQQPESEEEAEVVKRGPGRPRKAAKDTNDKASPTKKVATPKDITKPIGLVKAAIVSPIKTYGRRAKKDRPPVEESEESISEEDEPEPEPRKAKPVKKKVVESSDSEEDEVEELVRGKTSTKNNKAMDDSDSDSFPPPSALLSKIKGSASPAKKPVASSSTKPPPAVRTPTRTVSVSIPHSSKKTKAAGAEPAQTAKPKPTAKDSKKPASSKGKSVAVPSKRNKRPASDTEDDEPAEEEADEDDEDNIQSSPKTRSMTKADGKKLAATNSLQAISSHQPSAISASSSSRKMPPPSPPSSVAASETTSVGHPRRGAAAKAQANLRHQVQDLVKFEQQMRKSRKSGGGMSSFGFEGDGGKTNKAETKGGKKRASSALEDDSPERGEANDGENDELDGPKKKKRRVSGEGAPSSTVGKGDQKGKRKATEIDVSESTSKKPKSTRGVAKKADDEAIPKTDIYMLTTQVNLSEDVLKTLAKLGVKTATRPSQCTHLIASGVVRTEKFLCALAVTPFILSADWAKDSAAKKQLLPEEDYILHDSQSERKYKVDLAKSIRRAKANKGKLFQGHTFYVTSKIPIEPKLLKGVIQAFGGEMSTNTPTVRIINADPEHRHVISAPPDITIWRSIHSQGHKVRSYEFVLNSALRQELDWDDEEHILEA